MSFNFNSQFHAVKSRISPEETQLAVNKLLYEISQRKNEFLSLCTKEDLDFSSKLRLSVFRKILALFTVYPSSLEKEIILNKYTLDDDFIDYLALSNLIPQYEVRYMDPLLDHLNSMNRKIDNKALQVNTSRIGKLIDLSPIEKLNCQLNEENFMIKNAKGIMTSLMTKGTPKQPSTALTALLSSVDYDNDGKLSIGEVSSFMEACDIFLGDYDLRFFFEYFPRMAGKIPIDTLESFIIDSYQKQYEQTARTEFVSKEAVEAVEKQEMKDEQYYENIMKGNYVIAVIKECLLIFGQGFLMKYFSKYFEFHNNQFFMLDEQLIVGFKSLGYKDALPGEMGNFKLLCIHRRLALMNNDKKLKVNVEQLFAYVVDYFHLSRQIVKFSSEDLVQGMSAKYFKLMNEAFLNTVTDKINQTDLYQSQINEFEFRKKFINSFGFIDHDFFDFTIKSLGQRQLSEPVRGDQPLPGKCFSLRKIEAKTYIELAYNLTFMSMLRNYNSIGLAIDAEDAVILNQIYEKMERKIFQQQRIQKGSFSIETYGKALPKKVFEANYAESFNKTIQPKQMPAKEPNDFVLGHFKESAVKIEESSPCQLNNSKTHTEINIGKVVMRPKERVVDPIEVIPKLFLMCKDYIQQKYKLERIDSVKLFNIGICQIFRDQFLRQGIDIRSKLHYTIFIKISSSLLKFEDVTEFIADLVKQHRDSDGLLNIQLAFSKIEEILIQYSKACQSTRKGNE